MGCCSSSIEINVDDLRPYGFIPRAINSYREFVEMMARNRQCNAMIPIIEELVEQGSKCKNEIEQVQLDIKLKHQELETYKKNNSRVMIASINGEINRMEKHANQLITIKSVIDQIMRYTTLENISGGIVILLKQYAGLPMIKIENGKLSQILTNIDKRHDLTNEQMGFLEEFLDNIDEEEKEEEEYSEKKMKKKEHLVERHDKTMTEYESDRSIDLLNNLESPPNTL